jgi:hypothetical protein
MSGTFLDLIVGRRGAWRSAKAGRFPASYRVGAVLALQGSSDYHSFADLCAAK